jgi:hypothetical protein
MTGETISILEMKDLPYRVRQTTGTDMMGGPMGVPTPGAPEAAWQEFTLEIDLPKGKPPIDEIESVDEFSVNIGKPEELRAVTADLANRTVNYIHPALLEIDLDIPQEEIPELAEDVLKIVLWLVDTQGFQLSEELSVESLEEFRDRFNRQ